MTKSLAALDGSNLRSADAEIIAISRRPSLFKASRVRIAHNILLVDDTLMRRECLEYMLKARARDFAVESVARVDQASMQSPAIILLDIRSSRVSEAGPRAQFAAVRQRFDGAPVVAIADLADIKFAIEAIGAGFRGYIPTTLTSDIAIAAVRLVLAGGTYVPSLIDYHSDLKAVSERAHPISAEDPSFTNREAEILAQLQEGKSNKIIAYMLSISESTVKVHMRNIMRKLHATNRTEVVFRTRQIPAAQI